MRPPGADHSRRNPGKVRSESLRQRCNDRNTEEIIRFVRDIQFERQPTSLCLARKAPLPGIGQPSPPKVGTSDSGFLDRATDSNDSEEEVLDNEVYKCVNRKKCDPLDSQFLDMLTCPRATKRSNDRHVLARSLPHAPMDMYNNNNTLMVARQNSFLRLGNGPNGHRLQANTGNQRQTHKQLPPLSRDALPDRPSAPSPSRTPPLSDCGYIEEEPDDYIGLS